MATLPTTTTMSNEEFAAIAHAAGVEEGCEQWYGREIGFRQCEICKEWGVAGEIIFVTDDGDLCERHLGAFK